MRHIKGTVYLTGAGPGDIELLTLKAWRIIRRADVVIYDRLANPDILDEAPQACERIYVGKADGRHTLPQEEINRLLYQKATEYETVVRLKGGDPTLFGRGGEEAAYLASKGVPFVFIPGVTSAVAVPQSAGIPVTHRGIASSVRIVTGHRSRINEDPHYWQRFKEDETIVFLMGLHNLAHIAQSLIRIGKPADLPVAVISKGTFPDSRTVVGTLADIADKAADLPTPALIVVGEVVRLREKLGGFASLV